MRHLVLVVTLTIAATEALAQPSVEDIYVSSALRTAQEKPTGFCVEERVGFPGPFMEQHFTLHSIATQSTDGKVSNAQGNKIGQLRACLSSTADPMKLNFYAEGDVAAVAWTAKGLCTAAKADFPEQGIAGFQCALDLSGLPRSYVGGTMTTSSLVSRQPIGPSSDPAGYMQSSIVAFRLWKQR